MSNRDNHSRNHYGALTRRMALIVSIVSIIPMFLIGGLVLHYFQISYHQEVKAHLKELLEKHKQNVDGFLNDRLSDIRLLSRSYSLEQLTDDEFLRGRLSLLRDEYGGEFVDLGVVNDQGIQIAYAGPFKLARVDYSKADWFRKAIKSHYFLSDVFMGIRRLPHFIVVVRQAWKGREWLLRATIDFDAFSNLVHSIGLGETGSAIILNRKGEFQTQSRSERPYNKKLKLELLANHTLGDSVTILEKVNYLDRKYTYVISSLKNGEWIMIYKQYSRELYSKIHRAQRIAIAIFIIGSIVIGVVAYFTSRKMVKKIEVVDREKELMNEQIIETGRLASLGELAAGIAHEINNPVAIMVEEAGWIEDLLEEEEFQEGENLDEFERALRQINSQGKRCRDITHKLLSFARKSDQAFREVNINNMIEDVVGITEQRAKYSNIKISKSLAAGLPAVKGSPTEIQQVLLNLVNNALDAMADSGGEIEIVSSLNSGYIGISVSDTGPGIPRVNLARIFDPFFTTKSVGKGTGLGLSICYGIIKRMGGDILVESEAGRGTRFNISIPLPDNYFKD